MLSRRRDWWLQQKYRRAGAEFLFDSEGLVFTQTARLYLFGTV